MLRVFSAESGVFTIRAATEDILVVSSVGYKTTESRVGSGNTMDIVINTAIGNLNEVVVVGYGTTRKKDLTGAVANITSKDFQKEMIVYS